MSTWEKFIRLLKTSGATPKLFGVLHIIALIVLLGLCIGLPFINKAIKNKKNYLFAYKITILCMGITIFILEIFKQLTLVYHIDPITNVMSIKYNWFAFPFQFCSTPLYTMPFLVFLKEGNWFKKRLEIFSSSFYMFGGLLGILIPSFTNVQGLNYQSLIHHGIMILSAIFVALKARKEFKLLNLFESFSIFGGLLIIAIALNGIIPACRPDALDYKFNMGFISGHCAPTVPIIQQVGNALPYGVYFVLYIIAMLILSFLFYVIYSACINHRVDFSIKREEAKDKINSVLIDKTYNTKEKANNK